MARCQFVLFAFVIFYIVHCDDEERVKKVSLQVIAGDPLPFAVTENCSKGELHLMQGDEKGGHHKRPVAECKGGVWRPAEDYRERVNQDSTFAIKRTVPDDTGLYELTCDGEGARIDVFVAKYFRVPLTEGQAGALSCSFDKSLLSYADSVLLEKNGETVLELNLFTGNITGFSEEKVRLHSNGTKDGNFSLIFHNPQIADGGDYFLSLRKHGLKGKPEERCAVRVEVIKERDPDQTTTSPTPPPRGSTDGQKNWKIYLITGGLVVAVLVILAALLFFIFSRCGWCLKPRGASQSSGSNGPGDSEKEPLNDPPPSSANDVNVPIGVV